MQLDWRTRLLAGLMSRGRPFNERPLAEIRQLASQRGPGPVMDLLFGRSVPLPQIEDATITGRHGAIPVRRYFGANERPLPLILFFHGGGWSLGDLDGHDRLCRHIAAACRALVVAVDYRLAPENKFPIPLEDCADALQATVAAADALGARTDDVTVMGDSAGGNLAAALALMARDAGGPTIRRQVLIYPSLDGTMGGASFQRNAQAPILKTADMAAYIAFYAREPADRLEPLFSPLLAPDLAALPPALIVTAEYDPLCDDGLAYGERLRAAGVPAQSLHIDGAIHAFLSFMRFSPHAAPVLAAVADFVGDRVAP